MGFRPLVITLGAVVAAVLLAWSSATPALLDAVTPSASPDASQGNGPTGHGPLAFKGGLAGTSGLSEPSIDITADGRIFVTAIQGLPTRSPIYENVGGNWISRGVTLHRAGEIGGGDADLEIDSLGRFYHVDLSLVNNGMAVSNDGITWIGTPASHYVPVVDRQWLAASGSEYLYLITNQYPTATVSFRYEIGTPLGELGGLMAPLEVPVGCIACGPPGFPAVNPNNGYLYLPMGLSNGVTVYRSANDGLTFGGIKIPGSGRAIGFAVAAVDTSGTVYVAWGELKNGGYDIFLSRSTSHGLQWSQPMLVSSNVGTHIMPWLVAHGEGHVALAWYGTTSNVNPNTAPANTQWRVYYAESHNAKAATPTFTVHDLIGVVHTGTVSTQGLVLDGPDRSLGDFLSMEVNPVDGVVYVAFVKNDAATPAAQRGVWVERMPASALPLR